MNDNKYKYEILSPINDLKETKLEEEFDLALDDPRISNIAVMGPYSSGKSSIILSYLHGRNDRKKVKIKTINISLAKLYNSDISDKKDIEKFIIEKLFYSINNNAIKTCILKWIFALVSFFSSILIWCITNYDILKRVNIYGRVFLFFNILWMIIN